jgi:transposase InsO family protein
VQRSSFINLADAQKTTGNFINYYNNERLHSAIGFIAPIDKLNGIEEKIFNERKEKMKEARERRIEKFVKIVS